MKLVIVLLAVALGAHAEFTISKERNVFKANPNLRTTYALQPLAIPNDDGKSNFGDLIHLRRQSNDKLVLREVLINEDSYNYESSFSYINTLSGSLRNITAIRAVNLGRQRAYVQSIGSDERGYISVNGLLKKGDQIRLLIDIYAH